MRYRANGPPGPKAPRGGCGRGAEVPSRKEGGGLLPENLLQNSVLRVHFKAFFSLIHKVDEAVFCLG